ncbi:HNH endonuclease [Glutamicibacter arilaitensis]|uniref:HNH endonuclease n=1 Tax=Glutamicibacter arilaitensis TaxID=256701 RepID=UPI003F939BD6
MNKRTCTIDGCTKPHRAKGYCGTHYGKYVQKDRHKPRQITCVYCGAVTMKHSGGGRKYGQTCSEECRVAVIAPPRCKLPTDHWALWYGKSSAWPRYGWSECTACAAPFAKANATQAKCTTTCGSWGDPKNPNSWHAMSHTIRQCARCSTDYTSPYMSRVHCSDYCNMLDAKERGTHKTSSWISKRQRVALYKRDNYTCWLCKNKVDMSADPIRDDSAPSLDHIIPRSQGGSHDPSNLRTACRGCNALRSDSGAMSLDDAMSRRAQPTQATLFA